MPQTPSAKDRGFFIQPLGSRPVAFRCKASPRCRCSAAYRVFWPAGAVLSSEERCIHHTHEWASAWRVPVPALVPGLPSPEES